MAKFDKLQIGNAYNKLELAKLINEPKVEKLQAGLLYCDNRNTTILFITLDKSKRKKQLHYNDFFNGEYFEWDSQNKQSFENNRIQDIFNKKVDVHLMTRVSDKVKNKTQPFIYCGELQYHSHDRNSNKPVHITFRNLDFQHNTQNSFLRQLYDWKPGTVGGEISFNSDYKKHLREERKSQYKKPDSTQRKGLVTSRVGQGYYRDLLLEKWNFKCAVTGVNIPKILIASHIVPWKDATEEERLDPENGILLSPNYDALFDKHLISFSDTGNLLISNSIKLENLSNLGIDLDAKINVNTEMIPFLKRHRSLLI